MTLFCYETREMAGMAIADTHKTDAATTATAVNAGAVQITRRQAATETETNKGEVGTGETAARQARRLDAMREGTIRPTNSWHD